MGSSITGSVTDVVGRVLEPYVGRGVAETCVRATAISLGKTSDDLGPDDLESVLDNVRHLLSPITTSAKIEALVSQIASEVAS